MWIIIIITIITIISFFSFKLDLLCTNTYVDTHTGQTNHFFRINLYYLFTIYPIYSVVQKVQDMFSVSQLDDLRSAVQTGSNSNHLHWTDNT